MAYVELHGEMPRSPKTTMLMRELKIPRAQAVGHLACLWAHMIGSSPSGLLRREIIEAAAEWEGETGVLLEALLKHRWLDPVDDSVVRIHDVEDYTRQYRKARADYEKKKRVGSAEEAQKKRVLCAESAVKGREQNGPEQNRTDKDSCTEPATAPARVPVSQDPQRSFKYPKDFEGFYQGYPRKTAKGAALKAWMKLSADERALATAAIRLQGSWPCFREATPDKQPHPATWLNARRWEDEPPAVATPPGRASVPDAKDLKAGWDAEEKAAAAREAAMTPEEKAARAAKIAEGARRMGVKLPAAEMGAK